MPRCPFKGEEVYNSKMKCNMHLVATYQDGKGVYSDMLHVLGKQFRANLKADDQNIICIEGQPGAGKSTLGIQLAKAIQPSWSLEDGYIYDEDDLIRQMAKKSTNQVFLFDEASLAVNSRDSMTKSSRNIIAILDTCRSRHNSVIFVLPSFDDLNKSIRERLCQCRIYCLGRREKLVSGVENSRGFFQVYMPISNQWMSTYWNLVGAGIFPRLDEATQEEYSKIKLFHQDEYLKSLTEKKEVEEE